MRGGHSACERGGGANAFPLHPPPLQPPPTRPPTAPPKTHHARPPAPAQVCTLLAHRGKVLSGSVDRTVRVWDLSAALAGSAPPPAGPEITLVGHLGSVRALCAAGDRLISSSRDSTLCVWRWGEGWESLAVVTASIPAHYIRCLCVSGGWLIGGAIDNGDEGRDDEVYSLCAWDLATMEPAHMLPQPSGHEVWALLARRPAAARRAGAAVAAAAEVWAAVGEDVVVWTAADEPAAASHLRAGSADAGADGAADDAAADDDAPPAAGNGVGSVEALVGPAADGDGGVVPAADAAPVLGPAVIDGAMVDAVDAAPVQPAVIDAAMDG